MAEPSIESIFSPEIIENPYPMYQSLREGSPILELPDANMLVLTRYEDIQATLRDRTLGHADDSMMTEAQLAEVNANAAIRGLRQTMLLKNPPDHTRLRGLVVKAFDARRTEAMRDRIRAIANELVDGFIDAGSGDLVSLFTHPLPVIVICDLLGIPESDRAEFVGGSRVNGRLIDPAPMSAAEIEESNRRSADAAGSSVTYQGSRLERILRDMETLRHHGFANESRYGSVSQLRWGAELDYPLMLR